MRLPARLGAHFLHHLKIGGVILLIALGGALAVAAWNWPFTRKATIESLEQVSASEVHISDFRKIFFPHPGYIARAVTFTRGNSEGGRPIVRIEKITCRATWPSLLTFTHRIKRIELEGAQIYIPPRMPPAVRERAGAAIKTTVTDLIANGTALEIAPKGQDGHTIRFDFPELVVSNLARNKPIHFQTKIKNPNPPGELRVSGVVGPLMLGEAGQTQISGSFRLLDADLGSYKVIGGNLSATGRFNGRLGRAEIVGHAEIPNFEVTSSHHSLGLTTEYRAVVNGTDGDVTVESAQAHFLGTSLSARGSISGKKGKTVSLDFDSSEARIEDLLRLFVTANDPPLHGPIALRAHVVLPPTHQSFIRRVRLDGDFTITDAEFTNAATQEKADELSARARGSKEEIKRKTPEHVAEDLKGNVSLRDTIATVSTALFVVPGAIARGAGTYNVMTEAINLRGDLAMHASLSRAAGGGIKSILLVPLDPFFKKNGSGAVLPVRIGGTYSHPIFKVSLTR